ncbi:hypothetical protein M3P36_00255 [Altererythrobacter sp. KTW20L]|uniref:hypothetical protein n=1 Tax=Altererythrobacter sp. KTW20L TaxID=2942210 RepID=UPI0020BF026D|nr:hypothetical protein [Altererythrobacter sp. KTW20L]MCL6249481.1 hypothetical protein [Altererythrobacter sp. KTW20L]
MTIKNGGSEALAVYIEMSPDRYVLQPGEVMKISALLGGAPLSVIPGDTSVTVYAGNDSDPVVTINDELAKPDWNTQAGDSGPWSTRD